MAVLGVGVLFGAYWLLKQLKQTKVELTRTTAEFSTRVRSLEEALAAATSEKSTLASTLQIEQQKSASLGTEVERITDTVETLEKLTETDPELLKKYSKVYFLSEHYVPETLAVINPAYVVPENRTLQIHAKVQPFLEELLEDANRDDLQLRVVSAYRSFESQKNLKSAYTVIYGIGANKFSADQGYSEHQIGTTVDFATVAVPGANAKFEPTPEYAWLLKNAYKYGFVLSYPKNNAYYKFEPWHWRFVGTDLAKALQEDNRHLYDLDQREIDAYLLTIFD